MGDSLALLASARDSICAISGMDASTLLISTIYETPALLPENAPDWWNRPYLNQVIVMCGNEAVFQAPEALLASVKTIETALGRQDRGRWSPREIDIDILAIEGVSYHSDTLTIPHAEAHKRAFVLQPLCEMWEDCVLADGTTAKEALVLM